MSSRQTIVFLTKYEQKLKNLLKLEHKAEFDGALPPELRVTDEQLSKAKKQARDAKRLLVAAIQTGGRNA